MAAQATANGQSQNRGINLDDGPPACYHPSLRLAMAELQKRMRLHAPRLHDIEGRRAAVDSVLTGLKSMALAAGVEKRTFQTIVPDGSVLTMAWYSPCDRRGHTPAIVHIHGGGTIAFDIDDFHVLLNNTVAATAVPMLTINYRLAPEHPFPTPLDDCYSGLLWLRDHAGELQIDTRRIAVMGESAGGGFAAAVSLMARDRGLQPPLAKQILICPMLDDRSIHQAVSEPLRSLVTHDEGDNLTCWSAYLGQDRAGSEEVSKYAAPAREGDLGNLPSTYIDIGEFDLFLAESVAFAAQLSAANDDAGSVRLEVYSGVPHGFDLLFPEAEISRLAMRKRIDAITSF